MHKKTGGRQDGCLIGFKSDKFELEKSTNTIKMDYGHKYEHSMDFQRGGVAVFARLKSIKNPDIVLNIINTHLYWDPNFEFVRYLQTSLIYKMIEKHIDNTDNILLCGDFNATPDSNVVKLLLNKEKPDCSSSLTPEKQEIMKEIYEELKEFVVDYEWKSAYERYGELTEELKTRHPRFTQYTEVLRDNFDYIFYNPKRLKVSKLLRVPTAIDIQNETLPNKIHPSDHLPLMASFIIT